MPSVRSFAIAGIGLAFMALASPSLADQDDEPKYLPQGQWRLTTLADGCSIARDFERDGELVTFSIKRIHPRSAVQFAVIGAPILEGSGSLDAGFLPGAELQRFNRVASASIGDRDGVVFAGRLFARPPEGEERQEASEVTDFALVDPRGKRITLHTRAIDQAMNALDQCVTRKLLDFGLDMEAHDALTVHAKPDRISEWAKKIMRDYPATAVRNGHDGVVPMRLIVNEKGRVVHCHVTNFLTAKVLRDVACGSMIEHARYTPALDADGRPAKDFAFQSVRYALAGGPMSVDAHGFKIYHDED